MAALPDSLQNALVVADPGNKSMPHVFYLGQMNTCSPLLIATRMLLGPPLEFEKNQQLTQGRANSHRPAMHEQEKCMPGRLQPAFREKKETGHRLPRALRVKSSHGAFKITLSALTGAVAHDYRKSIGCTCPAWHRKLRNCRSQSTAEDCRPRSTMR